MRGSTGARSQAALGDRRDDARIPGAGQNGAPDNNREPAHCEQYLSVPSLAGMKVKLSTVSVRTYASGILWGSGEAKTPRKPVEAVKVDEITKWRNHHR